MARCARLAGSSRVRVVGINKVLGSALLVHTTAQLDSSMWDEVRTHTLIRSTRVGRPRYIS